MRELIVAVEIIALPPGEAPQVVRAAWIGLVLPLARQTRVKGVGSGVLTGPKTYLSRLLHRLFKKKHWVVGYAVDAATAVALLESRNAEAARWWRKNVPHLLRPGKLFLFSAEACREITVTEAQRMIWPPPPCEDRSHG